MMKLELDLDGMTWAELRRFVALSNEDDRDEVHVMRDPNSLEPCSLVLAIDAKRAFNGT